MQLVIEISDGLYNNLSKIKNGSIASKSILDSVRKGQVLPEGHGRLIDADALRCENADFDTYNDYCTMFDEIEAAETILDADKLENEKA